MGKYPERRCLIMSAEMRPISFNKLMSWMKTEYQNSQSIFGIHANKFYKNTSGTTIEMFGEVISSPVGPAADLTHS